MHTYNTFVHRRDIRKHHVFIRMFSVIKLAHILYYIKQGGVTQGLAVGRSATAVKF